MTDRHRNPGAITAGDLIESAQGRLSRADLFFGHGTDNERDEAAALVFHVMGIDRALDARAYAAIADDDQRAAVDRILDARVNTRKPLAYLTHEAWFAGKPYYVDERVLIPRSPLAELILDGFRPWRDPGSILALLELGTGCGCIAAASALALPDCAVVATDLSADALDVAAINIQRHGLSDRVQLLQADLFDGVTGRYDVIISNPPYVPEAEASILPTEYRHEPTMALFSGPDGLDSARRILQDARNHLNSKGILLLEVGAQWQDLERAFPQLPFTWLEFEHGGVGVALLTAEELDLLVGLAPANPQLD